MRCPRYATMSGPAAIALPNSVLEGALRAEWVTLEPPEA